ncbi:hypothetical protein AHF37_09221 [Paragonimus kellicotti]|nr:hypothetical protein AHF37_09221 [Paragonimus kellicotti]
MDTCLLTQTASNGSEKEPEEFVHHRSPSTSNPMGCYTLTGILEYLQDQWARMDMERSEWAVERAELQARIAFLQGECKGQENLKVDLVRRIKMLEYALLQERAKNFELKYPYETKVALSSINGAADDLGGDPNRAASQVDVEGIRWREERLRLKDYLISAGLGDAMARLRETRVRDLLAKTTAVDTANETPALPVSMTDSANLNPSESLSLSDSNPSQENMNNASTVTNFPVLSKDTSPNTGLSEVSLNQARKSVVTSCGRPVVLTPASFVPGSELSYFSYCWSGRDQVLMCYLISAGLGDAMARLRETRVRDLLAKTTAVDTANETPALPVVALPSDNHPTTFVVIPASESLSLSDSNPSQENMNNASTVTNFPVLSKDTSPNTGLSEALLSCPNYESSVCGLDDTLDVTDPETAEALAEFELLVSQQGLIGRISPAGEVLSALLSCPNYESSVCGLDDTLDVTDPETAEALAEFELLVSQQGLIGRISPAGEVLSVTCATV